MNYELLEILENVIIDNSDLIQIINDTYVNKSVNFVS